MSDTCRPMRNKHSPVSTWAEEGEMSCSLSELWGPDLHQHPRFSQLSWRSWFKKKQTSLSHPGQKKPVSSLHTTIINISVQRLTAQAWFIFTHVHIWIGSLSKTIIMVPAGFQTPLPSWEASAVKTAWMIFWSRGVHICAWLAQQ